MDKIQINNNLINNNQIMLILIFQDKVQINNNQINNNLIILT